MLKKRYLGTKALKEAWVQRCLFIKTLISCSPEKYETKFWMCLQYFARIRCSLPWTSDRKFNTLDWVQLYLVSLPWSELKFCQAILLLSTWIFPWAINHASHKSSCRYFFFKNFPWGNCNEVSQLVDKTVKYLCHFILPPLKRSNEAS